MTLERMMVRLHGPVRRWWWPFGRRCDCGRRRPCPPPDPGLDRPRLLGERLPDGDRVPWPTNPARAGALSNQPGWAGEPTQELNTRPWMTLGQRYRGHGGRFIP
jgi:hypothetical protein